MPVWMERRSRFPSPRSGWRSWWIPRTRICSFSTRAEENLEAVTVAVVTESPRLVMNWRGKTIVDLSRAFLDTNGAHQEADVTLEVPSREGRPFERA